MSTGNGARSLAAWQAKVEKSIRDLQRAPRLSNASMHDQPLLVYDSELVPRQTVGKQPDGTFTTVDVNGPPPPVPSAPLIEERAGTLVVTWDGAFADGTTPPADWDHVEVHVSTTPGYTPTDDTEVFTFHSIKGGSVTLALDPIAHYIVLQAVNTSRVESLPTAEVEGTPDPAATGAGGVQTYYEDEAPIGLDTGDEGALWFDTNDSNHQYRWSGTAWVSVRDATIATAAAAAAAAQAAAATALTTAQTAQTTADGKAVAYFQPAQPTGQVPGDVGDLWFDTDDGNKMYRYSGSAWVVAQDQSIAAAISAAAAASAAAGTAQTTADSKIVTLYQTAPPSGTGRTTGDLWVDTDDFNHLYRWSGSAWVSVRDTTIAAAAAAAAAAQTAANNAATAAATAQATADGAIRTYYQSSAPTGLNGTTDVGDMWFDTDDGQAYRWNGTTWVIIEDNSIAVALAAAQNAQTTADGKITSYYQTGIPVVGELGDLWYDTDDKNKPYYCSSISPLTWTSLRDGTIADAATQAAQAAAAAAAAQATANTAQTAATTDGAPPTTSPVPTVLAGIASMTVRWTPITNRDPVTYDVHVSPTSGFTPGAGTLVGSTPASMVSVRALPGPDPTPGTPDTRTLQYDTVYYVRVVARDADGAATASAEVAGSVFQVTGVDLQADSVTAVAVAAGSFTGEEFAGVVFIGSTFTSRPGGTGQGAEFGIDGFAVHRSDNSRKFYVPVADDEDTFVDGEFVMRGATVTGGMSMQSSQNEITKDAALNLAIGISPPAAAPLLATTYDTIHPSTAGLTAAQKTSSALGTFDLNPAEVSHIEWRSAGWWAIHQTRSNGTRTWQFQADGTPGVAGIYFTDLKDWEVWSTSEIVSGAKAGIYSMFRFIPAPGTDWYVSGPPGINKYTRLNTARRPVVGNNGTDMFVAEALSNNALSVGYRPMSSVNLNPLPAATTTYTSATGIFGASPAEALVGSFDFGATRYIVSERGINYNVKSLSLSGTTLTRVTAQEWESPVSDRRGIAWDGANFWSYGSDGYLYKHTSEQWDPTVTSSTGWFQTTFADSDAGGTGLHETTPGAARSINMKRRAKILVTMPPIPDNGGVDDPDQGKLYVGRGATKPTNANMHLQYTGAGASTIITTLATVTASPPTVNNFPGANPAIVRTAALDPVDSQPLLWFDGSGQGRGGLDFQVGRTIRKLANESVAVSATVQSDDHFFFTAIANAVYHARVYLIITNTNSTAGFKVGWLVPSGSFNMLGRGPIIGATTSGASGEWSALSGAITGTLSFGAPGSITTGIELDALIVCGATGGTTTLRWAQNSAANTTVVTNASWMRVERVG
jgi:hypothetical protein